MNTEYTKEAGIYKLTCSNGKIYIGKSVNLNKRLNAHKNSYKKPRSVNFLQNAITKYGWAAFNVEILETFKNFDKLKDNDYLLEREAYYIQLYESFNRDKGYNVCTFSNDMTGMTFSAETRERMKGARHTPESKEQIRKAITGMKRSDESKAKMRKPKSKEHAENIRKAVLLVWQKRKEQEKINE